MKVTFDGDSKYIWALLDTESKLKAFGGLGHHQQMDSDMLFRVSRYAAQPVTNLINLNTVSTSMEVVE